MKNILTLFPISKESRIRNTKKTPKQTILVDIRKGFLTELTKFPGILQLSRLNNRINVYESFLYKTTTKKPTKQHNYRLGVKQYIALQHNLFRVNMTSTWTSQMFNRLSSLQIVRWVLGF